LCTAAVCVTVGERRRFERCLRLVNTRHGYILKKMRRASLTWNCLFFYYRKQTNGRLLA
jgi:hypothetical protein